jgi:hypothetical protein
MARKDVRLMLSATEGELKMMHEMATTMDEYINLGYAKSDWTILAKGEISGK